MVRLKHMLQGLQSRYRGDGAMRHEKLNPFFEMGLRCRIQRRAGTFFAKLYRHRILQGAALVLLLVVLMLTTVYFSYFTLEKDMESDQGYVLGFTISTMNNPYCSYLESTLRSLVEADGHRLITLDPQYSQQKQLEHVETMLERDVDLIFLCPVNYHEITPALERCVEAGVPIVNFDCEIAETEYANCIVISNNYSAGYKCAEDINERMPKGAKIAIIDDQKAVSVVERMEGFYDGLTGRNHEVVIRKDSDGSLEEAMPIAMDFLQMYPQIDVIMCANDSVACGAVAAIEVLGMEDRGILVYGIDGSPEAKALIRDGKMTATIAQSPIQTAKICYEQALKILAGEDVSQRILLDVYKIDNSNLQQYAVSGWQ